MAIRVRFPQPGRSVEVEPGTLLLDVVRHAGLPIASACGAGGICARCGLHVQTGSEALPAEMDDERRAKARNRVDPDARLACRVRVTSDLTVTTTYW